MNSRATSTAENALGPFQTFNCLLFNCLLETCISQYVVENKDSIEDNLRKYNCKRKISVKVFCVLRVEFLKNFKSQPMPGKRWTNSTKCNFKKRYQTIVYNTCLQAVTIELETWTDRDSGVQTYVSIRAFWELLLKHFFKSLQESLW